MISVFFRDERSDKPVATWAEAEAAPTVGDVLTFCSVPGEYVVTRTRRPGKLGDVVAHVDKVVRTIPTAVSELGTRIVMCKHVGGSGVQVVHDEHGNPVLSVMDGKGGRVDVVLSHREALGVVEALVVAAKPGSAEATLYTDPGAAAERILGDLEKRLGRGAIDTEGKPVVPCPDCGEDVNAIRPGDSGKLDCDRCEEIARRMEA